MMTQEAYQNVQLFIRNNILFGISPYIFTFFSQELWETTLHCPLI